MAWPCEVVERHRRCLLRREFAGTAESAGFPEKTLWHLGLARLIRPFPFQMTPRTPPSDPATDRPWNSVDLCLPDDAANATGQATGGLDRRQWLRWGAASLAASLTGCGRESPSGKAAASNPPPGSSVIPQKKWLRSTPEEHGLRSPELGNWSAWLGGSGCLVRHGYLIHEWGKPTAVNSIWSASKPLYGYLLLRAVDQKLLSSLDDPVVDKQPGLAALNAALGYKDRRITWRHLLYQTSGYGLEEAPGAAFAYNDYAMTLLQETLVQLVYQATPGQEDRVLDEHLAQPLQFQKPATFGTPGSPNFGLIHVSMSDLARVGLLCSRQGQWQDRSLVRAAALQELIHTPSPPDLPLTAGQDAEMLPGARTFGGGKNQDDHLGSYSHAWWVNGLNRKKERLLPDAPEDVYGAFGHGGKYALINLPGLDLTCAWSNVRFEPNLPMSGAGRINMNETLVKLLQCVRA